MADTSSASLSEKAAAKINLFLHVVGRRADGMHLLESLVAFGGAGDRITARPDSHLSMNVSGPYAAAVPPGPDNLVMQAAERLRQICGVAAGAQITLEKCLPVAAGVGGGSADAAAVLRALSRLWDLQPTRDTLHDLALALGADVPVCLSPGPQLMTGIGEQLKPVVALPSYSLVLVNPGVEMPTADVFRRYAADSSAASAIGTTGFTGRLESDNGKMGWRDFVDGLRRCRNDLQPSACKLAPEIDVVLAALDRHPDCALARMSGSGATCFGLFRQHDHALAAATAISAEHPAWWVRAMVAKNHG